MAAPIVNARGSVRTVGYPTGRAGRFGLRVMLCRQPGNLSAMLISRQVECDGGADRQRARLRSHGLLPPHRWNLNI